MAFNAQGVCAATPLSAHADQGKLFRAQHGDRVNSHCSDHGRQRGQ
jgi:hypothetical protein